LAWIWCLLAVLVWLTIRLERQGRRVPSPVQSGPVPNAVPPAEMGVLGSGIAHDFNNLLAVIVASLDLADGRLPADHPAAPHIGAARRAALWAAQRLLSFSRRSALSAEPVRLDHLCSEAVTLVQPTVDPRIEIELRPAPGLWTARGDSGEIVQVIVNLLLNARDVMPAGGHVRLETENVIVGEHYARAVPGRRPGQFVCVRAIDDGPGMTAEVKARIFEPFFTTKAPGRGTGLGLAMACGTLQRHGGWIDCDSIPGHGTTFSLYFPRHPGAERALAAPGPTAGALLEAGRPQRVAHSSRTTS
jgi:signal transduction histidine kinase